MSGLNVAVCSTNTSCPANSPPHVFLCVVQLCVSLWARWRPLTHAGIFPPISLHLAQPPGADGSVLHLFHKGVPGKSGSVSGAQEGQSFSVPCIVVTARDFTCLCLFLVSPRGGCERLPLVLLCFAPRCWRMVIHR